MMSRFARILFSLIVLTAGEIGSIRQAGAQAPTLTVPYLVSMSAVSTADEYSTQTLQDVEVIEYLQDPALLGHSYNAFNLEANVSWCTNTAAPWIIVEKIHIMINVKPGEWFCGTVPQGWNILLDYPSQAYFSFADADTLKEAIGHPEAFRVI